VTQKPKLPEGVTLIVVTKGRTIPQIEEVYTRGYRNFGENRIEEALPKIEALPKDIRWHFIGRIQSKKISKIVGHFSLIHSVDREEVAVKLSRASLEREICTSILLQVNTSGEESKAGLSPEEWKACFEHVTQLEGVRVCGLMTMAPQTEDKELIRRTFSKLRAMRDELNSLTLTILSMGMSSDYQIAVEEGATMVRLGRALYQS